MNLVIKDVLPTAQYQFLESSHLVCASVPLDANSAEIQVFVPLCSPRKTSLYFRSGFEYPAFCAIFAFKVVCSAFLVLIVLSC